MLISYALMVQNYAYNFILQIFFVSFVAMRC